MLMAFFLQADSQSWKLWWSTERCWRHPWVHKNLSFSTQHKYLFATRRKATSSPTHWSGHWQWYPGAGWLLPLLGCLLRSKISWADHIEHIILCCKARKLVGMQFYAWVNVDGVVQW